jgi:hypothetical protein
MSSPVPPFLFLAKVKELSRRYYTNGTSFYGVLINRDERPNLEKIFRGNVPADEHQGFKIDMLINGHTWVLTYTPVIGTNLSQYNSGVINVECLTVPDTSDCEF